MYSTYHLGTRGSVISEIAIIFWSIGDISEVLKVTDFIFRGHGMLQ